MPGQQTDTLCGPGPQQKPMKNTWAGVAHPCGLQEAHAGHELRHQLPALRAPAGGCRGCHAVKGTGPAHATRFVANAE